MGRQIVIDEIDASVTEADLTALLAEHGEVEQIELVKDPESEEGFQVAFLTMHSTKDGRAVIAALDGQPLAGRDLKVKAVKGPHGAGGGREPGGAFGGGSRRGRSKRFGGRGSLYGHGGRGQSAGRGS
jgi:RNA recognition motif-containing protein